MFYGGLADGMINVYDIRNTNNYLSQFNANSLGFASTKAPIVSVRPFQINSSNNTNLNLEKKHGVCITTLNCTYYLENQNSQHVGHSINNVIGSFYSMSCDSTFNHFLYSLRPNSYRKHIIHKVYILIQYIVF